jgi:hypothetical protein
LAAVLERQDARLLGARGEVGPIVQRKSFAECAV